MGEANQRVAETVEARMCAGCLRMQDHIIRKSEKEVTNHIIVTIEEICTVCGGKRVVQDRSRGNYRWQR